MLYWSNFTVTDNNKLHVLQVGRLDNVYDKEVPELWPAASSVIMTRAPLCILAPTSLQCSTMQLAMQCSSVRRAKTEVMIGYATALVQLKRTGCDTRK
jgi:hypothetical protein